jgi:hypothetical protein
VTTETGARDEPSHDTLARLAALATTPVPTVEPSGCADCFDGRDPGELAVDPRPILVTGVPRSGTTWMAKALALTRNMTYLHEPDNPAHGPFAHRAKRGRGRYPVLQPSDRAPDLERCWAAAFGGARDAPRRRAWARREFTRVPPARRERALDPNDGARTLRLSLSHELAQPRGARPGGVPVVKSVHTALCLEWIAANWELRIVVIRRHPLDVVASWRDMGWEAFLHDDDRHVAAAAPDLVNRFGVPLPAESSSPAVRVAWLVGVTTSALDAAARAVGADIVDHETLCRDPLGELRWLARTVGLTWTPRATEFVVDSNQPGRGESTHRVAATLPAAQRERLDPATLEEVRRVLAGFPIAQRYHDIEQPADQHA